MQGVCGGEKILRVSSEGCSHCFPYDPKVLKGFTNILSGQSVFPKNHHLEPETTIYTWLFQLDDSKSLYRKWLFHHFHPFINGCLGLQAIVSSFATNKVHLDSQLFDAWKSSKNRLPNGWFSGDLPWYHLKQIQDRKKLPNKKQAQHQFKDILPPTLLTTSPNPPKIQESNVRTTWKQSKKMLVRHPAVLARRFFDVLFFVEVILIVVFCWKWSSNVPFFFCVTPKLAGWWFQPYWRKKNQNGNLPQIGVKTKNIWNHHLVSSFVPKPREDSEKIHHKKTFSLGKKLLGEILLIQ